MSLLTSLLTSPLLLWSTYKSHPTREDNLNIKEGYPVTMLEEEIEIKVRNLPNDVRKEILDYIDFLLSRYGKQGAGRLMFDWEGGLSDIKNLTSVELQHRALEWR